MPVSMDVQTQYRKFVAFAEVSDSRAAAGGDIKRAIVPMRPANFVGNIARSATIKGENDYARRIFMDTILKMCGVSRPEDLPESVKSAMKLEDYGKGKPLTARRIVAVTSAVDDFTKSVAKLKSKAEASLGVACSDASLSAIVDACGGDREALRFVGKDFGSFLVDDRTGQPLPPAETRRKVEGLVADLKELHEAAKGDRALLEAGSRFIEAHLSEPCAITGYIKGMMAEAKAIAADGGVREIGGIVRGEADVQDMLGAYAQFKSDLDSSARRIAERCSDQAGAIQGRAVPVSVPSIYGFLTAAVLSMKDDAFLGKMQAAYRENVRSGGGLSYSPESCEIGTAANFVELSRATKGNLRLFNECKASMERSRLHPAVFGGVFSGLFSDVGGIDVGKVKRLKASDHPDKKRAVATDVNAGLALAAESARDKVYVQGLYLTGGMVQSGADDLRRIAEMALYEMLDDAGTQKLVEAQESLQETRGL